MFVYMLGVWLWSVTVTISRRKYSENQFLKFFVKHQKGVDFAYTAMDVHPRKSYQLQGVSTPGPWTRAVSLDPAGASPQTPVIGSRSRALWLRRCELTIHCYRYLRIHLTEWLTDWHQFIA